MLHKTQPMVNEECEEIRLRRGLYSRSCRCSEKPITVGWIEIILVLGTQVRRIAYNAIKV